MNTPQALLDLEWVLTSPSLVDHPLAVGPIEFAPESVDLSQLDAFLAERAEYRVGRYFEALVHFWLLHVRQVEILGAGIQIIDDQRRTLGELDFVFRDEDGAVNHWEVAVKFFLHYPNDVSSHFPGPASRDNFERKSTQLFDKQLWMSAEHRPDVSVRAGFVRGRVFTRLGACGPVDLPDRLAPDRLGGLWLRESELHLLDGIGDFTASFVSKPHWFAPVVGAEAVGKGDLASVVAKHFDGPAYPVMLSLRDDHDHEIDRCFIVPDAWPAEAPRRA